MEWSGSKSLGSEIGEVKRIGEILKKRKEEGILKVRNRKRKRR